MSEPVTIVGGGLAGCECAWQLARRGVPVVLHEMRPKRSTPAHKTGDLAELVCSNSLRSDGASRGGDGPVMGGGTPSCRGIAAASLSFSPITYYNAACT